ncbi:MAG: transglycosylase domain-containing protein [Deltaproteobacteria bacterium]|nr:transglycosylase domain-containing protein [Deltaproteobacteria bacterium]
MLVTLLLLGGGLWIGGPYAGAWYLKQRLIPRVAKRLQHELTFQQLNVGWTSTQVEGLELSRKGDKHSPLLRVARVKATYSAWDALARRFDRVDVTLHGLKVAMWRDGAGQDNFSDLLKSKGASKKSKTATKRRVGRIIHVMSGSFVFRDAQQGIDVNVGALAGQVTPEGQLRLMLGEVQVGLPHPAPRKVSVDTLAINAQIRGKKRVHRVEVGGGRVQLLPRLELSGIRGTLIPESDTRIALDLTGSYGGATARLWSAKGVVEPRGKKGKVSIRAARFSLAKIRSILAKTPVILPDKTTVDGQLEFAVKEGTVSFEGKLGVSRLNLFHPGVARTPVRELSGTVVLAGKASRTRVVLDRFDVESRGVKLHLTGAVERIGKQPRIEARLIMEELPCQDLVNAFPVSLVPALHGFKLRGKVMADLKTLIDYADLDNVQMGGKFTYRRCKVVKAPEPVSAERLLNPFEHSVEARPDSWKTFKVGPENPDFTPFAAISPHVIAAFLTTEDAGFFRHRGFIPSQFRAALSRNLKRGGFRLGASTISMQMVKNVLLSHEKTLSRKLQELFLTWYLERELSKERLMEIYLNVIEFGPGIYGIGQAARHYFGKTATEITPLEAAFFATILPSPRRRYVHYCRGAELGERWDRYVRRVLRRMHSRQRITDEDLEAAKEQKILFARPEDFDEKACLKTVKDLGKAWRDAYYSRLKAAVKRAAPHQLRLYLPPEMLAPDSRRKK